MAVADPEAPELERTEVLTVRIDPDPQGPELRRVLLEMGPLRAYFGEGELLVTSILAADSYYQASYEQPLVEPQLGHL